MSSKCGCSSISRVSASAALSPSSTSSDSSSAVDEIPDETQDEYTETPPPPTSVIPEGKCPKNKVKPPCGQKFFIVIHENNDFAKIIQRPFYKELADRGTLLTNYHGLFHPSQPNYLALI